MDQSTESTDKAPGNGAENGASRRNPYRALFKGLAMLLLLGGAAFAARALGMEEAFDKAWIDANIRGHGLYGYALYVLGTAVFTGFGLPRQIPAFLGGYAFGALQGTLLATLGAGLGCLASFTYARYLARSWARRRFGKRLKRVDDFLGRNTFSMAVVARLMPFTSNVLTNLAAGLSSAALLPFLAGSLVGYLPQSLVFALAGKGTRVAPELRFTLAALLFVAAAVLGVYLYRRHRTAAAALRDD